MKMKKRIAVMVFLSGIFANASAQFPGGVKSPCVWFQTESEKEDVNGKYKWVDQVGDGVRLYKGETKEEVTSEREKIHTYNFNPAIRIDSTESSQFTVKNADLSRKTVVSVVGTKVQDAGKENVFYRIDKDWNVDRIMSRTKVIFVGEDYDTLSYKPNLKNEGQEGKIVDRVKIHTFMEATQPTYSIWGANTETQFTIGGLQSVWKEEEESEKSTLSDLYMPEMAVYPRMLRHGERLRVESYLALKYGIPLSTYIGPSGEMLWPNDSKYSNRVVGYGRDDRSGFEQFQSATSYEESVYNVDDTYHQNDSEQKSSKHHLLVMGFADGEVLKDSCYVLFGDNNKSTGIKAIKQEEGVDYTDSLKVMERIWKTLRHGLTGEELHEIELGYNMTKDSLFASYVKNSNLYMLIDRSGKGDFKAEVDTIQMSSVDLEREKALFTGFKLDSVNYFTFAFSGTPEKLENEDETYDYILEVKEPECGEYGNLAQLGELELQMPEVEGGVYYSLYNEHSLVSSGEAEGVLKLIGMERGTYYLKVLPKENDKIQFSGDGVTLLNISFLTNDRGAINWEITEAGTESKVAFVLNYQNDPVESSMISGVRILRNKMYLIDNGVVSEDVLCDVKQGDEVKLQRVSFDKGKVFLNGEEKGEFSLPAYQMLKVAVKSVGGNVSGMYLEDFNWNGKFEEVIFDPYRNVSVSSSGASMSPTLFVQYEIDFNVECSKTRSSESIGMQTYDNGDLTATATVDMVKPGEVTFFVYDMSNVLVGEYDASSVTNVVTERFPVPATGVYLVIAVTSEGDEHSSKIIIK